MTALPNVTAIGANNIQNSSANLVGAINPQGVSGTAWFQYGTTPALGTNTPTQTLQASAWPQTIVAEITGLTPGTTYYFAAAATTTAGTVVSVPLTFTSISATVTSSSTPGSPVLTPSVTIPHVTFPLTIDRGTSGVRVAEQGSVGDIRSCVRMVMACPLGACPELPSFGFPDETFGNAESDLVSPVVAAIQRWEPRVLSAVVSQTTGGQVVLTTETFLGEDTLLSESTFLGGTSSVGSGLGSVSINIDAQARVTA